MKKDKIVPGYKFSELTVIQRTADKRHGYTVWLCRCSCGKELCLDTRYLQRKTIKDCGCITRLKPGRRDLTNMRFGKLVCLEPVDEQVVRGQTSWLCQCDCGKISIAATGQLLAGYKKSCGCLSHPPLKDFIGRKFGKLTVTEYSGKVAGMHRWKCICECGKETVVGQTLLQTGKTQSCGCLSTEGFVERLNLHDGTSIAVLERTAKSLLKSNKSGYAGVYQDEKTEKWRAQITFKGKTHYLGSFSEKDDAIEARQRAEETMHKKFLRDYYQKTEKNDN